MHDLISKEAWAKADLDRLKKAAFTGNGFASAFLYALGGNPRDAAIAQQWLLEKYGKKAYWTVRAAERLNGEFFKGGQVGISEVYYDTDIFGYLWGFRRTKPWGAPLDGYVVLDALLKDGGPLHEAPIYPIAHERLLSGTSIR